MKWTDFTNDSNLSFCDSTSSFDPVSLKYQFSPPCSRIAASMRWAGLPSFSGAVRSTTSALPAFVSIPWLTFDTSASGTGDMPSCPAQRLMFASSGTPALNRVTATTVPGSSFDTANDATRSFGPATSFHPSGTSHWTGAAAGVADATVGTGGGSFGAW